VVQLVQSLPRRWRDLTQSVTKYADLGVTNLIRLLPRRVHGISDEVAKFAVIGIINVFVNLAVYNLLLRTVLDSGEVKAKAIATVVAATCAYFMNRHWTYRDRPKSALRREYTLFLFFNAVGLVIEVAVVWIAKYGFGATSDLVFNICTIIGIVLGTIFRFWAYRNHVFKIGAEDPATPVLASDVDTPADEALHAELTQIELEGMVAEERSRTRGTN
jgi:putative flippase GtrA